MAGTHPRDPVARTEEIAIEATTLRLAVPLEQLWHPVPGGTARATTETVRALADRTDVRARGVAGWHRRSRRGRAVDLVPVAYLPWWRPLLYEGWLRAGRPRIERHVGPVDVAWAAAMVVPATRAPVVATVHDLGFLDAPEHLSRRGRHFFPRAFAAVRDRAALVVCPSAVVADACTRHGIDRDRIRVIGWGVGAPLATEAVARAVVLARDLPDRFVLWVGTVEPRKNLTGLVAAMERLAGVDLVVVGPDGWNVDAGRVLAPLGDRVHRLGRVDELELSALYRAATVFAYPSLLEGFGLPVLEAMAHGTPVVTSSTTATAEAAGGAGLLVDPTDPDAIAGALASVLDDPARHAELAERGRRRAREQAWSSVAERYVHVFSEVVDR